MNDKYDDTDLGKLADDKIRTLIDFAEDMSFCTCERCGAPGTPSTSGWIKVECSRCKGEI